jgi:TonB family protein
MQASAEFSTVRVRRGRGALAPWVVVSLVAHVLALGLLAAAVDLTSPGRSLGELVYRALGPLQIRLVPPEPAQEASVEVAAWEATPVAVPAPRATRSPRPQETVKASKQAPRPAVRQRAKPPRGTSGSVGSRAPREPERDIVKRDPAAPARAPGDTAVERPVAQTRSTGLPTEQAADASEILRLLHQEIDRHKRYPPLARRHGRQGTSTVAFSLRPDGGVEAVALARSSGFRPLDRAALRAVQQVAPFAPARDYLTEPRGFRIDVVFRLY